jgi:short-subunit dehydrogenase
LARILAKEAITINAVCPAGVATNIVGPPGAAETLRERGFELMEPSIIADAVVHAISEGGSGRAWMCQAGRPPERYEFAKVPGID